MSPMNCIRRRRIGGNSVHLANKSVLVDDTALLPAGQSRRLGPHLLYVLEHHVAMPVECLDASQELAVVAERDEDLGVTPDRRLEDG